MDELLRAVHAVLDYYGKDKIILRHLFYRISSIGVIPKEEKHYQLLGKHVTRWREDGLIPYGRFADGTRWHRGGFEFDDAAEALEDAITGYRKNLWRTQRSYVEVWCEKEAIASIVVPIANSWGIPTFPTRGFPSVTSIWNAAQTFKRVIEDGKRPVIFYLGDYDKSGLEIDKSITEQFARHGLEGLYTFQRLAILPEQIDQYNLPTRPPKTKKNWDGGDCVEIDTLSTAQIHCDLPRCQQARPSSSPST